MKKLIRVIGLLLVLNSNAITSQQVFNSFPGLQGSTISSVTVQGHGSITMPPDQATLRFSISDKGRNLEMIKNKIGNVTSRFLEFAENLNIKKKNLRTTNINIFPELRIFDESNEDSILFEKGGLTFTFPGTKIKFDFDFFLNKFEYFNHFLLLRVHPICIFKNI